MPCYYHNNKNETHRSVGTPKKWDTPKNKLWDSMHVEFTCRWKWFVVKKLRTTVVSEFDSNWDSLEDQILSRMIQLTHTFLGKV